MSVHGPSKTGKFIVRWRSEGKQRSKSFTRERDARLYEAEIKRRLEMGDLIVSRADVPTLQEEADSWLASRRDLSPRTLELYAETLDRHILPYLGDLKLVDLRPRRLEQWQQQLSTGTRAVQMARGILSQILDRAVAHEYLASNGLKVVKGPRHAGKVVEPATAEQVEIMRSSLNKRDAALISLLAYVGLRPPQESHGLMWSDLEGPRLRVRRRNAYGEIKQGLKAGKRERVVDLPGPVAQELAEMRLRVGRPVGLIWPRRIDGLPWTKTDWGNWSKRHFAPARDAAGLGLKFTPYDLRHTCASLMLAAGRPLPEVAHQLGHSIQVCASTYAHMIDAYRGTAPQSIEDRINESRAA